MHKRDGRQRQGVNFASMLAISAALVLWSGNVARADDVTKTAPTPRVTLGAADSLGQAIFAARPAPAPEPREPELAEVGAAERVEPERWLRTWRHKPSHR